jgi:integrase
MIMVDCRINGRGERKYFATKDEAEGEQQRQRVRRANEGLSGLAVPERLRVEAVECQRRLQPFNASLTDATDFFLKHSKPTGGHRTVKELVDEFIAAKRLAGRREEYLRIQASILGMFEKAFPDGLMHQISPPQIEAWLNSRGDNLRTRRNYQNDLRNLFNFAIRRGYVASNPVDRLEKIILDEKSVEILTVDQSSGLLQAAELAGGEMTPFISLALFGGLRTRELAALDWKNIGLSKKVKVITIYPAETKTRAKRNVKISDNLAAWLLPYSKQSGPVAPEQYRQKFEDIRRAAGIDPWPRNCMRHSAISYRLEATQDAAETALQSGHDQNMLFKHYHQLVEPEDAARYWQIMPASEAVGKVVPIAAA